MITRGVIPGKRDTVTMSYDALNNRLKVRRIPRSAYAPRSGVIHQYAFTLHDTLDIERSHAYPRHPNDSQGNPGGYTVNADSALFAYDALGNITRADNRDALIRRGYYLNGLIRGDTLTIRTIAELGAGGDMTTHVYPLSYTYDLNGRRAQLMHPLQLAPSTGWQGTTRYAYNVAGNLIRVTNPMGYHYEHLLQRAGSSALGGPWRTGRPFMSRSTMIRMGG